MAATRPGEIDRTTGVSYQEGGMAPGSGGGGGGAAPAGGGSFEKQLYAFMLAIGGLESGFNPTAASKVNTGGRGRAKGLFQFLDATWRGVAPKVGVTASTASAASPEDQWKVAAYLMTNYYKQFGDWGLVAAAWFAGPGRAKRIQQGDTEPLRYSDGNITVKQYMDRITRNMAGKTSGAGGVPGAVVTGASAAGGAVASSGGGSFAGGQVMGAAAGDIEPITDTNADGVVDEEDVRNTIRREFGYMSWAIDHPELGPILIEAAENMWDEATLRGAIQATEWFKTHAISERTWEATLAEDPAEAARQIEQSVSAISDAASTLGLDLDDERVRQIAVDSIRFGWTQGELTDALTAELEYDPQGGPIRGTVGATMDGLRQLASSYYVQMGEEAFFDWTKRILSQEESLEGFETYVRDLAAGRFPHLKGMIDQGMTPRQFYAPYQEEAARLLELSPGAVDLMNDPKLSRVLDPVMGQDNRPTTMSLTEFGNMVRGLPEWGHTRQAQTKASALGQAVLETFGKVR